MIYKQFQDLQLSALGFGAMRLPLRPDGSGSIDQTELNRMVDAAMAAGVNYFDTAHPYHDGKSEGALGRSLARYPRETWYLADKFPGHQNVHGVKELHGCTHRLLPDAALPADDTGRLLHDNWDFLLRLYQQGYYND